MDIIAKLDVEGMSKRYPEFNKNDIEKIRLWMNKNPHLPKIEDLEIFYFLHTMDFSVEASKTRIDNFYTCRTHLKHHFDNRDPDTDEMEFVSESICHVLLPKSTPDKHDVLYMKLIDPANFSLRQYMKYSHFAGEPEMMNQSQGFAEGVYLLCDLQGSLLSHLAQVNFSEVKKIVFYLLETYPIKIKGAHFINAPFPMLMDRILSLIRPLLPSDRADMLHVHDSIESLAKYIPLECLPNDYEGGGQKSAVELNKEYRKYILQNREYFLEEPKCRRVNEKLRPAKMKSNMDIFGVEGNFKKLDID